MEDNNFQKITCPHCGYQYLPAEIFVDRAFTGRPVHTVRDALGKILYTEYTGEAPSYIEHYICDNCNTQFAVEADIKYKTMKELPELDFSEQTVSLLD